MTTLGEAFHQERERLRELLGIYEDLGPVGTFGLLMIKDCLRRADKAVMEQDLVAMVSIYKEMQGFKE